MHFNSLSALAGAGKTHEFVCHADKLARQGRRVLFVQPTKLLIDKTVGDELSLLNPNYAVPKFHGNVCDGVISKVVQHFKNPSPGGQIVFITHAAFMMTPYFHKKRDWIVLFDEVPGVIDHFDLMLPNMDCVKKAILALFGADPFLWMANICAWPSGTPTAIPRRNHAGAFSSQPAWPCRWMSTA